MIRTSGLSYFIVIVVSGERCLTDPPYVKRPMIPLRLLDCFSHMFIFSNVKYPTHIELFGEEIYLNIEKFSMELCTGIRRSQYSILSDKDSLSPSRRWNFLGGPLRLSKYTLITALILLTSIVSGIGGYLAGKHLALGESTSLIQCKPFYIYSQSFRLVLILCQ